MTRTLTVQRDFTFAERHASVAFGAESHAGVTLGTKGRR